MNTNSVRVFKFLLSIFFATTLTVSTLVPTQTFCTPNNMVFLWLPWFTTM